MTSTADRMPASSPCVERPSTAEVEEETQQLRAALESRALIGQAMGILMTRLDVDAEVAFSYLRRRAMQENRQLVEIAKDIARIRQITWPKERVTGA